ncbi:MAG: helix-hairpin-helix domain-containing protein [Bacteroidota bacterium]|nr:helix-hairpin-helix domain-containing protein [Bacteroidota bacterium]
MRKDLLFIIGCFGMFVQVQAQNSAEDALNSLREVVTEIVSRTEETAGVDELADMLYRLANSPVAINSATSEEIERLFWLSDFQVQNIRKYILEHGPLATKYELTYIQGISEEDAKLLGPFLSFETRKHDDAIRLSRLTDGHNRLIMRSYSILEKQKGYLTPEVLTASNHFTGTPSSLYMRYAYDYENRILVGVTGEKDAGEEFFSGKNKNGFDFYSFHLQVNRFKFIKTLVLGDYRVNYGQGLAVWSGFSFGKTPSIMSSMQRSRGISAYQSADENNFFRGAAMTLNFKPFEISAWVSRHRVDANVTALDSATNTAKEVSSLQTSGLHASPGDIADEDALRCDVLGENISFIKPNLHIGTTAIYHRYSGFINPESLPYNLYYFRGESNYNLSFDYRYRIRNVIIFGEEAACRNGGMALLNGFQAQVNTRFGISLINRYYQQKYQAMFGNAFGENSRISNESGMFVGVELKPLKYVTLSGYIDLFRFPWLAYGIDMPSDGHELMVQLGVIPSSRFQISFQYRNKKKNGNFSEEGAAKNSIINTTSDRIRCQTTYTVTNNLIWRNRLEFSNYYSEGMGNSRGFYTGQELEFSMRKLPLKVYLHYGLFDTDDYNARIYAYESDLLYTFNIPALSGKGSREFMMIKYAPTKNIDLWIKYSASIYAGQNTVGSGLYEIAGNKKSEVRAQLLFKF